MRTFLSTIAAFSSSISVLNSPIANNPIFGHRTYRRSRRHKSISSTSLKGTTTTTITEGVEYNTIAREWRCKWSNDTDKISLVLCQSAIEAVLEDLTTKVDGVKDIERIVCTECLDFKVIVSLSTEKFDEWKSKKFMPESDFIDMLESIDGVSSVETQTYAKMSLL
mmetsp:Transcript_11905/g.13990  ORF Transcript_11905/g.13990 Transcript_11905/m.13990 type:complete len:166 (+) Transcript_11905:71-568(+)|eukprot:CAMPEP_0198257144 /NCGR_PEP_ID=MMETSP1447-20131203/6888_1 /TAXON_ID=420782 /ORGANISM="Chaetoceros dichaeta, Strain CCMP1751" /LENGTH=165 /DNA_ID=CAMNT_0043943967 /DNA_START=51 /DNA_END=548 /DNA_ORIENTATION=-